MSERDTYRDLRNELLMGWDSGDRWGSAMGLFFDLAAELWNRDDATVPDEWQYSPGAMGGDPREPDSYNFAILADAATRDLERLGAVLHRYTDILRAAGDSY